MLLTTVTGSWVSPDLERAMCAIFHTFLKNILPGLKIIDILTNQPGRRASSRLNSYTTEVCAVRLFNHPVYGDRLVFVETPGLDDIYKSDLEILLMVKKWLEKA
jgi:hypothetical protein